MPSSRLRLLVGVATALVFAAGHVGAQTPLGPPKRDGVWGQDYSDLKPEAGVIFGQLPNGLRYAIKKNATPKGQVALRLRIGSGSLEERDDQQGLAHFLEHLAFKGSTHAPNGEMVKILQRKGLAFGADTNASTNFDQTIYQLDLPESDDSTVDTGLMLLREVGSELTLDPATIDPERSVVLSEERLRESPAYRSTKDLYGFLMQGQRVPTRWPIGRVETIRTAPVSLIRQFYEANYRPDNATVVAVGDFDPAAMEAKIKARFGDWKAKAAAPSRVDPGSVAVRGEAVELFVAPSAPSDMVLAWARPWDPTADVRARERRDMIQTIGSVILNQRLAARVRAPGSPLVGAGELTGNELGSLNRTEIVVDPAAGRWKESLAVVVEEERRIARYGVRSDELTRALADLRSRSATDAAGADTRPTTTLADEFVSIAGEDEVFTGPVQNLALFEQYVAGLTLDQVNAVLRAAFTGSGPLLFMSSPDPVEGGEGALKAALDADLAAPLADTAAAAVKPWPYTDFGAPGRVVERREAADLGVTHVRFANGVRLMVKPTKFAVDQIGVELRFGHGRLDLPRDRPSPTWSFSAVGEGGTRELTVEEIQHTLAGRVVSAGFGVGDEAFQLAGGTRRQDLELELQLLTAYLTRPGFRPEAFLRQKAGVAHALEQIGATPGGVFARDGQQMLHAGDPRWRLLPTAVELAREQPEELPAALATTFATAPVAVVIVGDVDVDAAIAAVGATVGALPARAPQPGPSAAARATGFPAPTVTPVVETHAGRADQAMGVVAWPTPGFYADPHAQRVRYVLAQVFENRLIDRLRVAEGATYSPNLQAEGSQDFPSWGIIEAAAETPPDKLAGFNRAVSEIAASLRAGPPTADELDRAKKPAIEQQQKQRESNAYWANHLGRAFDDPRDLDMVRNQIADLKSVTAAEVQASARTWLDDRRAWRMEVRPTAVSVGR